MSTEVEQLIMRGGMTDGIASVTSSGHAPAARHRIVLAPNCALTPRTARIFLCSVAIPTLGIAGVMAVQGLWPILPFAGLELAALAIATRWSMRKGQSREVITITETQIVCESWRTGLRESRATQVFPRHWAKVKLHAPLHALHPSRLTIESQGRTCEVGRFLTEDERRGLATHLKQLIGNMNESPVLGMAGA